MLTPVMQVNSRTLEGATLRRHVLRGAVLVFVTAGYSGKRFVFEKAKELGVRSVILDGVIAASMHSPIHIHVHTYTYTHTCIQYT